MKLDFKLDQYGQQEGGSFDPLPAGNYLAEVFECEVKETKAGTGEYLQITWEIVDGPYKGRKIWDRLNIVNQNETAQRIGRERLNKLANIVGKPHLKDTDELYQCSATLRLVVREDPQYGASNDVKDYRAPEGFVPAPVKRAEPSSVKSGTGSVPPWKKASS